MRQSLDQLIHPPSPLISEAERQIDEAHREWALWLEKCRRENAQYRAETEQLCREIEQERAAWHMRTGQDRPVLRLVGGTE